MRINVLIENSTQSELLCEHGLSFLIHFHDKVYLLDAGQTGAFIENARALNIDLSHVDKCILSHGHYDHSDGFIRFLELYPHHQIWACDSVFDEYYSSSNNVMHYIGLSDELQTHKEKFNLVSELTCIDEGVYLLPHHATKQTVNKNLYKKEHVDYIKDDFKHELSLIFCENDELIVFNSCSHVGMASIRDDIKKHFPTCPVKAYFGGLHMKGKDNNQEICVYSDEQIDYMSHIIKKENMIVYTGHCTGDIGYSRLSLLLDEHIQKLYSGLQIKL